MSTLDKLLAFAHTLPGILIIIGTFTLLNALAVPAYNAQVLVGGGLLVFVCLAGFGIGRASNWC